MEKFKLTTFRKATDFFGSKHNYNLQDWRIYLKKVLKKTPVSFPAVLITRYAGIVHSVAWFGTRFFASKFQPT